MLPPGGALKPDDTYETGQTRQRGERETPSSSSVNNPYKETDFDEVDMDAAAAAAADFDQLSADEGGYHTIKR